jgi:hypothetical protein
MLQVERCTDPSASKGERISRDNLPERVGHLRVCDRRVVFVAMMCLDRDVHQLMMPAQ